MTPRDHFRAACELALTVPECDHVEHSYLVVHAKTKKPMNLSAAITAYADNTWNARVSAFAITSMESFFKGDLSGKGGLKDALSVLLDEPTPLWPAPKPDKDAAK